MARTLAEAHGLRATFMPKPFASLTGSGCHSHVSLVSKATGENVCGGGPVEVHGLSQTALKFLGGLLAHAPAYTAITNPSVNSFKRLNARCDGRRPPTPLPSPNPSSRPTPPPSARVRWPPRVTGRQALVRRGRPLQPHWRIWRPTRTSFRRRWAPLASTGCEAACPQVRACSSRTLPGPRYDHIPQPVPRPSDPRHPTASPAAPPPVDLNMYDTHDPRVAAALSAAGRLPPNLREALEALDGSAGLRRQLGNGFVDSYLKLRRAHWQDYTSHLSHWEVKEYLDC
eukprot:scaffold52414_cov33-Tisochrysis_lutea.AAC.1